MRHPPMIIRCLLSALALLVAGSIAAEEIGCVTTAWKLVGANHRICVDAFDDPQIPGVACHVSQARKGGIAGSFGLAQDPSEFSLACRQVGSIQLPTKMPQEAEVFSEDTSILFKETRVVRLYDARRNTLIYVAISRKLIDGAPANSLSTVPIQPWGGR
jgi:CreA protein